jgi:hypothetical protein
VASRLKALRDPLPQSYRMHSMENEASNGHENYEWISTAALLVAQSANRAHFADSGNDSLAGFGLPQTDPFEGVSLMVPSTTKELEESPMEREIAAGTILIKDGALLPTELQFESEPCVPGWRLIKDFDGYGCDRAIQKTGWTFFCLAGEIKATVFGIEKEKMVHKAIERILAKVELERFNSLEITRVDSVCSGRFPLVRYVTVRAESRHIQESMFLSSSERIPGSQQTKLTVARTKPWGVTSTEGLASEKANERVGLTATPSF